MLGAFYGKIEKSSSQYVQVAHAKNLVLCLLLFHASVQSHRGGKRDKLPQA